MRASKTLLPIAWGLCSSLMACLAAQAQPADLRARVEAHVSAHQQAIVRELAELVAIPNVAADRVNIRRNAEALVSVLGKRGFAGEVLETDGNPLAYGELRVPGAARTLLLYCHYDGQPADPARWQQASPWQPVMRTGRLDQGGREVADFLARDRYEPDWRLYARSASDDKGPIVALLAAIDALSAAGIAPTSNLRVILEGEEEAGSPSLVPAIARYRDKLAADLMLIFDGPAHFTGQPTLVFGARGIVTLQLTVYGPKVGVHSGNYGNWVPNPALALVHLLASMKGEDGNVLVAGFYDDLVPLTAEEQALLAAVPEEPERLLRSFGIAAPEKPGLPLQQALQRPTLNVRGLASAYVGAQARTIIPDRAVAEIDVRLVEETRAEDMVRRVREHVAARGFHLVDADPDDATRASQARIARLTASRGTSAFRTSPVAPGSKRLIEALARAWGERPVVIRTAGGTVPIAPFIEALGFPAVLLPTVNFDNNQHEENENLRLGHLWQGITSIAAVLTMEPAGAPTGAPTGATETEPR